MAQRRNSPYDMPQSVDLAEGLARLTPREREVVDYLAAGKPNKVIAIELGISQRTAEAHRARIFAKLAVRNAVELVRLLFGPSAHLAEPVPVARDNAGEPPAQGELAFYGAPQCIAPDSAGAMNLREGPEDGPPYLHAGPG